MKPILFFILLAAPLRAELLATFQTTRGDVEVALQYDKAPQTVANFITLAQGTRTRIDPITGAVIRKPLYAGETFFRVESNPSYKIAQTGSGTGGANGRPGYEFRDEFHPALTHVPYVLSMANRGVRHTNGSQIYFTGSLAVPSFDNRYTVFGLVTDPASRGVIDTIIAAGAGTTTINSVSFQRSDPAALAFDEHAWRLPVCTALPGGLEVNPGVNVIYQLAAPQPGGSLFAVRRSAELQSWGSPSTLYQAAGRPGANRIIIDGEPVSRAFYNVSLVTYPDALAPDKELLANRTLIMTLGATGALTFQFDGQGLGGIMTYSVTSESTPFALVSYDPYNPYKADWTMNTVFGGLRFRCILNTETATAITGTNTSEQYRESSGIPAGWYSLGEGTVSLSKP